MPMVEVSNGGTDLGWGPVAIRCYHDTNSTTLPIVLVWNRVVDGKTQSYLEIYNESIPNTGDGKSFSRTYSGGTAQWSIYGDNVSRTTFTFRGTRSTGESATVSWTVGVRNPSFGFDTRNYLNY